MPTNSIDELKALLQEAKNRGIQLTPDMFSEDAKKFVIWKTAENGYFSRSDGRNYKPNDKSKRFIESNAMYLLLSAARGSGKSAAGSQKSLKKIMEGEPGAIYNPSFTDFADSTWPEFREWIPWDKVVPKHRHRRNPEWRPTKPFTMTFRVGDKEIPVICKGLRSPDSARGPNINWLWYDEGRSDRTGESWQIALASVRIGFEPQAWVTSSPGGKSHWMYDFFIERDLPHDVLEQLEIAGGGRDLFEVIYTSIFDNKDNLDPAFFARMLAAYPSGYLRRQEIFGEFVSEEGSIGGPPAEALRNSIVYKVPDDIDKRIRFYDLAATERKVVGTRIVKDPDETVGTLASWTKKDYTMYIEEQVSGRWGWDELLNQIAQTAMVDGPGVRIYIEQEPASGGINQVKAIKNFLVEHLDYPPVVEGWNPKDAGDRVMGANYWFADAMQGRVFVMAGPWNEEFFRQVEDFPIAKHDDKVTSVTGCRYCLAPIRRWNKMPFMSLGGKVKKDDE